MVICPIARAVHCTGCLFFKFCPAKTTLGDYGKEDVEMKCKTKKAEQNCSEAATEKSCDHKTGE